MLNNITEHTALIDNKRVCLGEIHEYLYENINDIHDNIKNKKYEKVLTSLLLIQNHTFMSINRMRIHNVNKKITAVNKQINNSTKKNDMKGTTKKPNKYTNANKKITNPNDANEKITSTSNTNNKITSNNNANKKVINANNANEKSTNGNNSNNTVQIPLKKAQ